MRRLNSLTRHHTSYPDGYKQALNQEGEDKLNGHQERCNMEPENNLGVDINREPLKRNIYLETPSGLEAINKNTKEGHFTSQDQQLLVSISSHISLAVSSLQGKHKEHDDLVTALKMVKHHHS